MKEQTSGSPLDRRGRVLYIGGFELPDKNAAAHRVLSNAKLLQSLGWDTVFVGISKSLPREEADVLRTGSTVEGFAAYAVPYPASLRQWVRHVTEIRPYLRVLEQMGGADIVLCYNLPAIALGRMRRYCRAHGMQCIADVTEWYAANGKNPVMYIAKGLDTFWRMRVTQKRMDGMITISRYLYEYYRSCPRVCCLPPLEDTAAAKWNGSYPKDREVLRLVYAGDPGKKDRVDLLIEALKDVTRDYRLDVIGIEEQAYLRRQPQHEAFLRQQDRIVFHGRLPHTETLEYIKKANYSCFFRYPDRVTTAGFPTKFVEAITCGTPVMTNRSSNVEDYIAPGKNGVLIEPLDARAIAEAIEHADGELPVDRQLFDYRHFTDEMQKTIPAARAEAEAAAS